MTELGLLLLYAIAHGGRVSHRVVKDVYRPGIPQPAICEFQPKQRPLRNVALAPIAWAWAGVERPRGRCCAKCLSQSQFFE